MFENLEIFQIVKSDELLDLFATSSSETNNEINNIFHNFQSSYTFFEYYTKKNINKLLSLLSEYNSNISEIFDETKTLKNNFNSPVEVYISTLSKIYLALNLIHKNHEILCNFFVLVKNSYYKLCSENKLSMTNIKSINDYINELVNIYSKNNNISTPKFSEILTPKKDGLIHMNNNPYNETKLNFSNFSINRLKSHKLHKTSENLRSALSKKSIIIIGNENNSKKNIDNSSTDSEKNELNVERQYSSLSLSQMKFVAGEKSPDKNSKKNKNLIKNKSCHKSKFRKFFNKHRSGEIVYNHDKEMYRKLLEIIFDLYKNCIINSEEKLQLKHLIISKSNKIEQIYTDYFIQCKYDKNIFISKVKKLLKN